MTTHKEESGKMESEAEGNGKGSRDVNEKVGVSTVDLLVFTYWEGKKLNWPVEEPTAPVIVGFYGAPFIKFLLPKITA